MEKQTCPLCGKPYRKGSRWWIADCDHTDEEFRAWATKNEVAVVDVRTEDEGNAQV